MIITYHGKQFFKLQQGDYTLAYNPISKDSKLGIKPPHFGSNLTLVSVRHPNYNGTEHTSYGDTEPFEIQGPGSYEVAGVTVNGFGTKALVDDEAFINTIYFVNHDDISYCFIGDLEDPALDQHIKEFTDAVDVLFVPIGSNGTLNPSQAAKLSKIFSPKVIIPMDYGKDRDTGSLETFLKEVGGDDEATDKFVFKKSDLDKLTGKVVVIKEQ
jgi:L-ascorbate metabolism protein UlaG (beta-lactamase superfamily)